MIGPPENVRPVDPPETSTEVTVPDPAGAAQVPSPRQYVAADALRPLLSLPTGRSPVTPVDSGNPVPLVRVIALGVPRFGVESVGELAKTSDPVPVASLTAASRLALVGAPSHVATPEPKEVMPVPPLATASVPASVSVPVVVTGPPEKLRPGVPPEALTDVTVPPPRSASSV